MSNFLSDNAIFVALAAAGGIIATCWGYISSAWERITSYVIVTATLKNQSEHAVTLYCLKNFKRSMLGRRFYDGVTYFVRPLRRNQAIGYETIGESAVFYWDGWKPIWISKTISKADIDYGAQSLKLSFLRGFWDLDNFIIKSFDCLNMSQSDFGTGDRHYVKYIFGTGNRLLGDNKNKINMERDDEAYHDFRYNKILKWKSSELGPVKYTETSLSHLALSEDAASFVEEVKKWKESESWFNEHGVPWRLGCLLHGEPGNGKTALSRGIAEHFDLPVFIYDLSSLSNKELKSAWNKMLQSVPCIAMIEDIDNVFHGRENIVKTQAGGLTFDCLLNCIDGIQRSDGLLLIITTNKIDKVDSALGIPDASNCLLSTRPGRIDRIIEMKAPDFDGKIQICRRILSDHPDIIEKVVFEGKEDSGAAFQDRCSQIALKLYWEKT